MTLYVHHPFGSWLNLAVPWELPYLVCLPAPGVFLKESTAIYSKETSTAPVVAWYQGRQVCQKVCLKSWTQRNKYGGMGGISRALSAIERRSCSKGKSHETKQGFPNKKIIRNWYFSMKFILLISCSWLSLGLWYFLQLECVLLSQFIQTSFVAWGLYGRERIHFSGFLLCPTNLCSFHTRKTGEKEAFVSYVGCYLVKHNGWERVNFHTTLHWLPLLKAGKYFITKKGVQDYTWKEIVLSTVVCWLKSFIARCVKGHCEWLSFS